MCAFLHSVIRKLKGSELGLGVPWQQSKNHYVYLVVIRVILT